jgi:hypothetical protein
MEGVVALVKSRLEDALLQPRAVFKKMTITPRFTSRICRACRATARIIWSSKVADLGVAVAADARPETLMPDVCG